MGTGSLRPAVLGENVRGSSPDAEMHRVATRVAMAPVSEAIGHRAGQLIGCSGMSSGQAVDAMVATTAIAAAEEAEAADRCGHWPVTGSRCGSIGRASSQV